MVPERLGTAALQDYIIFTLVNISRDTKGDKKRGTKIPAYKSIPAFDLVGQITMKALPC